MKKRFDTMTDRDDAMNDNCLTMKDSCLTMRGSDAAMTIARVTITGESETMRHAASAISSDA